MPDVRFIDMIMYERVDGRDVVRFIGELDELGVVALEAALTLKVLPVDAQVVVDLTQCRVILSIGIAVLVRAYKQRGQRFRVVVIDGSLAFRILDMVGVTTLFVDVIPRLDSTG